MIELLIVIAILMILAAIAVPPAIRLLDNAAETAVVREMQTIHQVQLQYMTQYGGYAPALAQLGPASGGHSSAQAAGLIPASLASGEKDGYIFAMDLTPAGYAVRASPKFRPGERRHFYLDENGVVHQSRGQPATAESPELK